MRSNTAKSDSVVFLEPARTYNLQSCFELLKTQKEAHWALEQLQKSDVGQSLMQGLKQFAWCDKVLTVLFEPDHPKRNDLAHNIRSRTKDFVAITEGKLRALIVLNPVEQMQAERVLVAEVASFYLQCLKHVPLIRRTVAKNNFVLQEPERMILEALIPKLKGLLGQVDQQLQNAPGVTLTSN